MMRGSLALALSALVCGCSQIPAYQRPTAAVPPAWPSGPAYSRGTGEAAAVPAFEQAFTDPRLHRLVAQALANNRDLRVASANVLAARARVAVQRAAQLPQVDIGASVNRRTGGTAQRNVGQTGYAVSAGISAFELDLFGRLAAATAAERETALASEAAARSVRLALLSDLVQAWTAYAADIELLRLAHATADNARRSLALNRALLQAGVAPRSDVSQAEQLLATAEGDLARQLTAQAQDRNLIDLLAGSPVDPSLLPDSLQRVQDSVQALPAGQDSAVLLRRPDVIEAEHLLLAANADVGAARAALFPRISLTGLLGLASDALGSLFTSGAFGTTQGGTVNYALFAGGGGRAGLRVSQAQFQGAVANYERAVQTAFRDVADALARSGTIGGELAAAKRQVAATGDVARLVAMRYRGGVASSLENLDAQRSEYAAHRNLIAIQQAYVENRIALFRALGGDRSTSGDSS